MRLNPLLPALLALPVALLRAPALSPDGLEMAAAGACLWRTADPLDCGGFEPLYWPPAFPLLAGALASALPLERAALTASLLASALLAWPLCAWARRLGGEGAEWAALLLFALTPAAGAHALMGEARPLALLGLLTAGHWALSPRVHGLAPGAALALACASRPEALAPAGLLLAWLTWREPRRGAWAALALSAWIVPYSLALSQLVNHFTISARGWQGAAWGWLAWMPEPWAQAELAAGSWGTPLRARLSASGAGAGSPGGWAELLGWAGFALGRSLPLGLVALGALGLRGEAAPRVALGALALPALGVALLPQARDPLLPANNLLLPLLALVVLGAGPLARLARRSRGLALGACLAVAVSGLTFPEPRGEDPEAPGLRGPSPRPALPGVGVVAASPEGSPDVLAMGLRRRRLPPPWMVGPSLTGPERAEALWIVPADLPAAGRTLAEYRRRGALGPPLAWEGLVVYPLRTPP